MKILILSLLAFSNFAFAQESLEVPDSTPSAQEGFNARPDNTIGTRFGGWLSQWSASAFSFAGLLERDVANEGGSRITTSNYVGLKRWLSNGWRGGVNIPFDYRTVGYDRFNGDTRQEEEFEFTDLQVEFVKNRFARLPWEIEMREAFRIYLPTGERSKDIGQIARFRNYIILTKRVSRSFEMIYHNQLNYYHQSQTAYLNQFIGREGNLITTASLTPQYKVAQWIDSNVILTEDFGFGFMFGLEDTWYNESEVERKKKQIHEMKMGPTVQFAVGESFRFQLAYEDVVDATEEAENFGKFKSENSQLILLTFIDL